MNPDFLILQAQFKALRNFFMGTLSKLYENEKDSEQKIWEAKYLIWQFEREFLNSAYLAGKLSTLEEEKIDRRLFQLQVLSDAAYIRSHYKECELANAIDTYAVAQALHILEQSDGSEEDMCRLIDEL